MAVLKAGAAKVDITPPLGAMLCGFGPRRSETLHDSLNAKALVLDDGRTQLALVTCDLISFGYDIAERVRGLIEERIGLPPTHVMLNCSHTHSGPCTTFGRSYGEKDTVYIETLVRKIAGAVLMAWDSRRDARLGIGRESVQIGVNRRELTPDRGMVLGQNWDGPVNPNVDVLRVDGEDGRTIAVLFSHAAHPVTLGGASLAITADYPGCAAAVLEKVLAEDVVAMFAQGCCGNINTQVVGGTFEDARRLGTILGAAALKAVETVELSPEVNLSASSRVIQLPLRVPTVEAAEATFLQQTAALGEAQKKGRPSELRRSQAMLDWARDYLAAAKAAGTQTQLYEIQVFGIDRTAVVGLPGEVFVELGLNIEARSAAQRAIVLGYANEDIGFAGYVPTEKAFEEGGYEPNAYCWGARSLPLEPIAAELIEQAAIKLVAQMFVT